MEIDALDAVIQPLISAICPKHIDEPKTRIAQLVRKMLRDQLGDKGYVDIIDRFILDGMEKNPEEAFNKLLMLRAKLTDIIDELVDKTERYVECAGEREE